MSTALPAPHKSQKYKWKDNSRETGIVDAIQVRLPPDFPGRKTRDFRVSGAPWGTASAGFRRALKEAQEAADAYLKEAQEVMRRANPTDPGTTVAQWARWFVDNGPLEQADGTVATYDDFVRSHIDGTPLGRMRLLDVREAHGWEWLNTRRNRLTGRPLTGWTPYNHLRKLKTIFNAAARNGMFGKGEPSPIREVKIDPPDLKITMLSPEQIDLVLDALPPWMRGPVITHAELGVRTAELLGLREGDVNLTDRTVDGVPPMTAVIDWQREPRTRTMVPPKRGGRRPAPISAYLAEELRRHLRDHRPDPVDGYLFCAPSDSGAGGRVRNGSMASCTYQRRFRRAVAQVRAAHPDFPQTGKIVPHGLRHHYSSQSLADGVPEAAVAAIIGHRGTATIRKVYEHTMPQYLDDARQARERGRLDRTRGPERDRAEDRPTG